MMEGVLKSMGKIPTKIREKLAPVTTDQEEKDSILHELRAVSEKMRYIQAQFDLVCDSDLVESCIYEWESLNARYRFLLQKARQLGVRCEPFCMAN